MPWITITGGSGTSGAVLGGTLTRALYQFTLFGSDLQELYASAQAMEVVGFPPPLLPKAPTFDNYRELFARAKRPDAVFVANDHMAIAVMDVLRAAGLPPEEIAGLRARGVVA